MKFKDGYYAKDLNGDAYWYEEMPERGDTAWVSNRSSSMTIGIKIDGPWENSLHKVENGKVTKVITYERDQKVLVSDDGEECEFRRWYRRHYSHCKNGIHCVFSNGKTLWSQEGTSIFRYIKPAEEE